MKLTSKLFFGIALTVALTACGGDDNDDPSTAPTATPTPTVTVTPTMTPMPQTIVDMAVASGNFTTLVAALQATGLDATLDDENARFTVFAPTDAAFAALGQESIDALLADTETLSDILLYHVVADAEIDSGTAIAAAGTTLAMANGDRVGLSLSGDSLLINLATVTTTDITTANGVIHVIDAVLMPPAERGTPSANIVETAIAAGNFGTLVAAVQAAGLVDTLADPEASFTVFAPTDEAFERLGAANVEALLADTERLTSLLLQHVVAAEVTAVAAYSLNGANAETASGAELPIRIANGKLRIGGAEVVSKDIYTSNGIIHVIDTVIVGEVGLPAPAANIAEVAVAAGGFTTLVTALQATGLDAVIADADANFTVFAPTDAAFAALGEDTIAALLADTDTLSDILLYHVIPGATVLADGAAAVAASSAPFVAMANGDNAALSLEGPHLVINLANVSAANVMASNGVIHVIDKVILPPSDTAASASTIAQIASSSSDFTTLTAALQAALLLDDLNSTATEFTVFAPTNAAFAAVGEATLNALLADPAALRAVLGLHVIAGASVDAVSAFALNGQTASTLYGEPVLIDVVDGALTVGGATVTSTDIRASNGIIHVIDAVITEAAH